jgi:uncharacterized protein YutE (UPF0331/DUF86 family)
METIKTIFKKLSPGKYISKDDKTKLEELRKTLIDIKYNKLCEELNDIISKNKLSKKSYETILKILDSHEITTHNINSLEDTIKI